MELTPRKHAILSAIINSYIATGEPVGSKALCELLDFGLSSATLRNEMSDLCSMGYLEQPHTSAGRVPTYSGYRIYVDDIMNSKNLSPEIKLAIDSTLETVSHTPEQMSERACQILADLTGLPSFTLTVTNPEAKIKRVRLIPMGKKTLLLAIISTDGVTKSRIVLSDCDVNEELLSIFSNICKVFIVGHKLQELSTAYLQTIVARLGDYGLMLMPLLSTTFDVIGEMAEPRLEFKGESNLLSGYRRESDALRLGELIKQKEAIIALASRMSSPIAVVFGDDYGRGFSGSSSSMVVAKYRTGDRELGRIGVIGPTRISYEQLIPSIEYFADRLGKLMTKALRDMED